MGAKIAQRTRQPVLPPPSRPDPRPARPTAPARPARPTAQIPGPEILERILEPLTRRQGLRHGLIGKTQHGKTTVNAWIINEAIRMGLIDVALILDDKDRETKYVGTERVNVADARARPPGENEEEKVI